MEMGNIETLQSQVWQERILETNYRKSSVLRPSSKQVLSQEHSSKTPSNIAFVDMENLTKILRWCSARRNASSGITLSALA